MELHLTAPCNLRPHAPPAYLHLPKATATGGPCTATATASSSAGEALKPRPRLPQQQQQPVVHSRRRELGPAALASLCDGIERLIDEGRHQEARDAFRGVRAGAPFKPLPASTYDALATSAAALREPGFAAAVLWHMESSGFEPDQYAWNRVLGMQLACGMVGEARQVFEGMPTRSDATWGTMMGGLVDARRPRGALALFQELWEEVGGDAAPRVVVVAVRAVTALGSVRVGQQLHCCIAKTGMYEGQYLSCALIDMYSKCGLIEEARRVFDGMAQKSVVAWNSMLTAYSLHGCSEEALDLYHIMCETGVDIDQFTFSTMLRVFSRLGLLENAKQAHAGLIQRGLPLDIVGNTALTKKVTVLFIQCEKPVYRAYQLGLTAAVLLVVAHAVANFLGGCACICSQIEFIRASINRKLAAALIVLSWLALIVGFSLLLAGAMSNSKSKTECGFVHGHTLSLGGIMCFVHGGITVAYYVTAHAAAHELP
ncbi:hypothetical protein E2562_010169 [Oryza meyeriana var. granulata]|uniref:Pentatricopeptide repeat-containing protein n=1 Tax=Oryza meyeriana var. granulata TaxID=110450 RepID=A0A6G1EJD2_9ORYZ|nr:hypothetical protein E2562_010169 [Oryza meyeriana var. granulata]